MKPTPTTHRSLHLKLRSSALVLMTLIIHQLCAAFVVDGVNYIVTDNIARTAFVKNLTQDFNAQEGQITIPNVFVLNDTHYWVIGVWARAFENSTVLTSINLESEYLEVRDYAFLNCTNLQSVKFKLPTSSFDKKTFGVGAFSGCTSLTNIIDLQIEEISDEMFLNCKSLTDCPFLAGAKAIGKKSFAGCSSMTAIFLPSSLRSLGDSAFADCKSLEHIVVNDNKSLELNASMVFAGCDKVNSIICLSIVPPKLINANLFETSQYDSVRLLVPPSALEAYRHAQGWGQFKHIETLPYDFAVNGIYYLITDDHEVTVTHQLHILPTKPKSDITLPETVTHDGENYKVTHIGDSAYCNDSTLKYLNLPESITSIGASAFSGCATLYQTNLRSVSHIGSQAFKGCTELGTITADNLQTIGDSAFAGCTNIQSLHFPNRIKQIGSMAFAGCKNLKSIMLKDRISSLSMGDGAFAGCSALVQITSLPMTPPLVDNPQAFDNAHYSTITISTPHSSSSLYNSDSFWQRFTTHNKLNYDFEHNDLYCLLLSNHPEVAIIDAKDNYTGIKVPSIITHLGKDYQVTEIGDRAFASVSSPWVALPNSVKKIGSNAFFSSHITDISLGDSVVSIGSQAFASSKIRELHIPKTTTKIGREAIILCDNLESIQIDPDNPIYDSRDNCNALIETSTNRLLLGCKKSTIPPTVQSIADSAFFFCNISNIEIPQSLASIGNAAFMGSKLTSLELSGSSLHHMGLFAFAGSELKSVHISTTSLDSISAGAFALCSDLEEVILSSNIRRIGFEAFAHCAKLQHITIPNSVDTVDIFAFMWARSLETVTLGSGVKYIGTQAFDSPWPLSHALTSVTCFATTPPIMQLPDCFNSSYATATLYVPSSSLNTYRNNRDWSQFKNIQPVTSGIDDQLGDTNQDERSPQYDLMGRPVDNNYHGIIIRDGKVYINR